MIAAFDLDGTLLKKNCSLAFCRYLCDNGILSYSDYLYCAYTYARHLLLSLPLYDLHRLIFERLFQGKKAVLLPPFVEAFLSEKLEDLWYFPAVHRLRRLQKKGFKSMILSNSPSFLVQPIAAKIEIDEVFATEYQNDEQGRICGISTLMDGAKKAEVIGQLSSSRIVAFSDSHLDLSFLKSAHIAVAVNPKRRLKKIALKAGWEIL